MMVKKPVRYDLPQQLGFFVYQQAKLKIFMDCPGCDLIPETDHKKRLNGQMGTSSAPYWHRDSLNDYLHGLQTLFS